MSAGLAAVRAGIEAAEVVEVVEASALDWSELQPLVAQIDAEQYPIDALPVAVRLAVQEVAGFVKAPARLLKKGKSI